MAKTLGIDDDTHILLYEVQTQLYKETKFKFDIKDLIHLLLSDTDKAVVLIRGNYQEMTKNQKMKRYGYKYDIIRYSY